MRSPAGCTAVLVVVAAALLAAPSAVHAEGQPTRLSLRPSLRTVAVLDDNPGFGAASK